MCWKVCKILLQQACYTSIWIHNEWMLSMCIWICKKVNSYKRSADTFCLTQSHFTWTPANLVNLYVKYSMVNANHWPDLCDKRAKWSTVVLKVLLLIFTSTHRRHCCFCEPEYSLPLCLNGLWPVVVALLITVCQNWVALSEHTKVHALDDIDL